MKPQPSYIVLFILLQLYLLIAVVQAQDFKKDLEEMYTWYGKTDELSIQFHIVAYKSKSTKVMDKTAWLKKQGEKFWYQLGETEMVATQDAMVMVNHEKKDITVRAIEKKQWKRLFSASVVSGMDSIISEYDSLRFLEESGIKKYTIYTSKKIIKQTELCLSKDGKLVRLQYWYNDQKYKQLSRVEINFTHYSLKQNEIMLFSPERIVVRDGKIFKPSQKFSTYNIKIIDL